MEPLRSGPKCSAGADRTHSDEKETGAAHAASVSFHNHIGPSERFYSFQPTARSRPLMKRR